MDLPTIGTRVEIDPRSFPPEDRPHVERFAGTVIGYAVVTRTGNTTPDTLAAIETAEGVKVAHPDSLRPQLSEWTGAKLDALASELWPNDPARGA